MTVGERIKQRRNELHLTQEQLAKKVGYKHKSSINKLESDKSALSQDKIIAVAEALGVSPDYLFYGSELDQRVVELNLLTPENQENLLTYYNYLIEQQLKEKK